MREITTSKYIQTTAHQITRKIELLPSPYRNFFFVFFQSSFSFSGFLFFICCSDETNLFNHHRIGWQQNGCLIYSLYCIIQTIQCDRLDNYMHIDTLTNTLIWISYCMQFYARSTNRDQTIVCNTSDTWRRRRRPIASSHKIANKYLVPNQKHIAMLI